MQKHSVIAGYQVKTRMKTGNIQIRYNVSRRTAERMRDGVLCIIPDMDEIETFTKEKHWGFTNYSKNKLVSIGSS